MTEAFGTTSIIAEVASFEQEQVRARAMTTSQLLAEHDVCESIIRRSQPGVPFVTHPSSDTYHFCCCLLYSFPVVLVVRVGPRGGRIGRVTILDRSQPVVSDRVFALVYKDFQCDSFLRFSDLFKDLPERSLPSEAAILSHLRSRVAILLALSESDAMNLIREHIRQAQMSSPSNSVDALPGGAPGLHR